MARFSLTKDLHTGSPFIDGDHRELVALVNALFEAMEDAQASDALRKAMNDLIAYAKEHFGREEAEMERMRYVASLAHRSEHARLMRQIVGLKAMLDSGARINSPAVADFLRATASVAP
jgi:hemerythrin-like metal-binding protein